MQIFQSEIEDGLGEILSSKASISYASLVEKSEPSTSVPRVDFKVLAGINDKDLYYTQSILVTTSWNKNDDIFDKEEVWLAKSTPIHKPTNLEHDEAVIVGHITSNYPITEDGELIDENTDVNSLPNKFHILTGSVVYNGYTDPDLKERANTLIQEIEDGSKYVSMECFFNGFDYGLINKSTGEYKILARNNDTAFLTKHLRAYGGVGEHENYKIGRVLRNITFSGKGFVNRPANPESIIFSKNNFLFENKQEKNDTFEKIGVFSNQANLKEIDMNLETEIAELKAKLEEATQAQDAMTKEYLNKLGVTEEDKKKMKAEFDASLEQEIASKTQIEAEMKAKCEELQAALNQANETIAAYMHKEEEMMKKEKKAKRMASLLENGVDNEVAASTVEKFDSLDDQAFEAITSLIAAVKPVKVVDGKGGGAPVSDWKMVKADQEDKDGVTEDVSEALENVEVEAETVLSVGGDAEGEVNTTRAALVDFVRSRLNKKLNKGE